MLFVISSVSTEPYFRKDVRLLLVWCAHVSSYSSRHGCMMGLTNSMAVLYLMAILHAAVETLDNPDTVIPIVAWRLWIHATNDSGKMEIVKGPHYEKSFITIADAIKRPRGYFFRVAKRLICVTLSKDLDFHENKKYRMDTNKGEIYIYLAFIDNVRPLR